VQKPEGLTTFGRSIYFLTKSFGYKYLSLASDGQFSQAGNGQGHWLLQFNSGLGWSFFYNKYCQ
jgi:hypothetical protein